MNKIKYLLYIGFFISLSCNNEKTSVGHQLPIMLKNYEIDIDRLRTYYGFRQSHDYLTRITALQDTYKKQLEQLNYSMLSVEDQVDFHLLERKIRLDSISIEKDKEKLLSVGEWVMNGKFLYETAAKSKQGLPPVPQKLASDIEKLTLQFQNLSQKLSTGNVQFTKSEGAFLVTALSEQSNALKSLSYKFDNYLPDYKERMAEVAKTFNEQVSSYQNVIKDKSATTDDEPKGESFFLEDWQLLDQIAYSVEEVYSIADDLFKKWQKKTETISKDMGYDDWNDAYEKVKSSYVPIGKHTETAFKLESEAIEFAEENNIITIPDVIKETWSIGMIPSSLLKRFPFFLGGPNLLIAYPPLDMDEKEKLEVMRMNNPHFARAVLLHEIIPGHIMQEYMESIHKTYRRNYGRTSLWSEGMAFYWELLFYDMGFAETNEDKLGMLFFQKLRAGRVITSINYHTGKWDKEQCVSFFVDQVGAENYAAVSEAERAIELAPINYLIGGLMFMSLKNELVDNGAMTLKEFHDKMFMENFIPVNLLRYSLKQEQIPRNLKNDWRFYSEE